jgi:hypothetical protein
MAATGAPSSRAIERIERLCREGGAERPLRVALLDELRRSVGFDWFAWLLTDPETEVGSAPLADVPSLADLPRLIRDKYLTEVNRWTTVEAPAVTLQAATGAAPERSLVWRQALATYGVIDVASLVYRDPHGCWGWLDLWRSETTGRFSDDDVAYLAATVGPVTAALRRAQARTFDGSASPPIRSGPVALILSPSLDVRAQTAETEQYLRALVPPTATSGRSPPAPTTSPRSFSPWKAGSITTRLRRGCTSIRGCGSPSEPHGSMPRDRRPNRTSR